MLESLYLHLMASRLAPASEVTGGHTLPYFRGSLETHSKAVHLGIKDFKCDICDKAFSFKCSLNMHVNYVHKKLINTIVICVTTLHTEEII
jgi:hypothetical protein